MGIKSLSKNESVKSVELVDDALADPAELTPIVIYKYVDMVTISPYRVIQEVDGREWKVPFTELTSKEQRDTLEECVDFVRCYFKVINYEIELANRLHVHILTKIDNKMSYSKLQKFIHKKYGKPKVPHSVCCHIEYDIVTERAEGYIRKTHN